MSQSFIGKILTSICIITQIQKMLSWISLISSTLYLKFLFIFSVFPMLQLYFFLLSFHFKNRKTKCILSVSHFELEVLVKFDWFFSYWVQNEGINKGVPREYLRLELTIMRNKRFLFKYTRKQLTLKSSYEGQRTIHGSIIQSLN